MSTDIKLSKSQLSKMIQSGGLFGKTLGSLGKGVFIRLCSSFGLRCFA